MLDLNQTASTVTMGDGGTSHPSQRDGESAEKIKKLGNIGVTLLNTGDMAMPDILRYAQEAEQLGYEGFWATEGDGKDPFALLALAAHGTQHISLGTSIVSFYSRTPTLLAIGASTLSRMSGGRFRHFGIGTGGVYFTERGHGVKIEQPVRRTRETIEIIRGLLVDSDASQQSRQIDARPIDVRQNSSAHHRFSYDGELFRVRDFRLMEGPLDNYLPIYVSAIGPNMVRLAARYADGIVTNGLTEEAYERYQSLVQDEERRAGRKLRMPQIFTLMMMGVENNDAFEAVRRSLTFFFASAHYYPLMEASGYAEQSRQIQLHWRSGDFAAASRVVTDTMVEKFAVMGSPEQRRQKLQGMMKRGIYPILYPIWRPGHTVDDYFEIIHLAAHYLTTEEAAIHKR
jgi:5,10-methylenetetrahydromethanopterin reductase